MDFILLGEDDIRIGDTPVYAESGIIPQYPALGLLVVVIVTLVLKDRRLTEYREAMSEPSGNEELSVVFPRQLNRMVFTVRR